MAYNDHENVILNFGTSMEDAFICDKNISETIILLNQKGYVTSECCGGHSDRINLDPNHNYWEEGRNLFQIDKNISLQEQIKNIKDKIENKEYGIRYEVTEITENEIKMIALYERTEVYVFFPYNYEFTPINDFKVINSNSFSIIKKYILLRDENGFLKNHDKLSKEIADANIKLLEWAKTLPILNIDKNKLR